MENVAVNQRFWRRKSVLLTGHTGFKGGWLSLWLQHLGAIVSGYALHPPTDPSLFEVGRIGAGMQSMIGDVRDADNLAAVMAAAAPEVALHLAAQPLVRVSYADPVGTYAVNVMGTIHFLEAVRRTPSVRVAIVVTSDKCYENREWMWAYRENEPMGGSDPYSSSKGCTELVTSAYRRSFFADGGVALATVRAGNVIGGGDWAADRLVPDTVRAFTAGRALQVRHPEAVRPWQHVLEPLRGYLRLAELLWENGSAFAGGWNFGPRDEDTRTVLEVVRKAASLWGPRARWEQHNGPQPHEARYLKLDSSLARARLQWAPRLDVDTALEWTMAWYRAYRAGRTNMRRFTLNQIDAYEGIFSQDQGVQRPLEPDRGDPAGAFLSVVCN